MTGGGERDCDSDCDRGRGRGRGQVVLLAAGVVAVALVAMLLALLQVTAVTDVSGEDRRVTATDAARGLEAAAANASATVADRDQADATATAFGAALDRDVATLRAGWERRDAVVTVDRNRSTAAARARDRCPRGPRRAFGTCRAVDGVVVQERLDAWYVLAVALDVRIETRETTTRATLIVRVR